MQQLAGAQVLSLTATVSYTVKRCLVYATTGRGPGTVRHRRCVMSILR